MMTIQVSGYLSEHPLSDSGTGVLTSISFNVCLSGAEKLKGHDIMALERFDPEVKHMIVFDVLSYDSPVGDKGYYPVPDVQIHGK